MKHLVLAFDGNGNPIFVGAETILFANAKLNKSTSNVQGLERNSRSGNPFYDPNTGRFANGPPGVTVVGGAPLLKALDNASKKIITAKAALSGANQISAEPGQGGYLKVVFYIDGQRIGEVSVPGGSTAATDAAQANPPQHAAGSNIPQGVDPKEWARRMDAVRDAAREMDPMAQQDAKEWLAGKTNRPLTDDEIKAFVQDVHAQRVADLVDVLDHSIRSRVERVRRSRRMVRLVPPRGWVNKTVADLTDQDVVNLYHRLEARGFSPDELKQHLLTRFPADRQAKIVAVVGNTKETPGGTTDNSGGTNQ